MENSGINVTHERSYSTPFCNSTLLPLLLLSLSSQRHSPKTKTAFKKEYDYIIVGAGSAGSVVASRLTEEPCVSVLLLEAGRAPPVLTEVPSLADVWANTDLDWKFRTTPQRYTGAGLKGRRIPWTSGKTLGGSSTINGMLVVRGNKQSYDEWAENGATGWSYEEVLPYFKKLEDNTDPDFLENGYHSVDGPLTVSTPMHVSKEKKANIEAVLDEGYEFVDSNGPYQVGFFDFQTSIRRGQRCSTAKAYLVPAENRTNLDILSEAMVKKVVIENKKAVGVEFDFKGSTHVVKARREVILSAGTTNSAQLLLLSGIGPMSELMKFKIPLVADLPVGLTLKNHPYINLWYEACGDIKSLKEKVAFDKNIKQYIDRRAGVLTTPEGFQLVSFLSTTEEKAANDETDYSLYFLNLLKPVPNEYSLKPEIVEKVLKPLQNKTILTCTAEILRTYSVGTVSLKSTNPYDPVNIDPNYFSDFRDVEYTVQAMKTCHRIMANPKMAEIGVKPIDIPIPGCEEYFKDQDLYFRCLIRSIPTTANHQVGTAKMGDPADPTTVVDPQLRVKGIKSLRVVDASVMPNTPLGNTNIPTIMIAEKASDMIKETIDCGVNYK